MKFKLLIFLFCISSFASAQTPLSWYKLVGASLADGPVTLHLHKAGHTYFGYYYYNNQQKPIYFNGEDTSERGKVSLLAYSSNDGSETFSFAIEGSDVSGSWKKDEQSKALSFIGKEDVPLIPITFIYTEGQRKLRPMIKESPQATFFAGSLWPKGGSPLDAYIQKEILRIYDDKAPGTEISKLMLRNKNAFFSGYEEDFKDVKPADLKESSFMYMMDQSEYILMVYQNPKLMSIADFTYLYSGGAHGNYATRFHTYDLVNKRKLRLNDVITPVGKNKLNGLLAKAVRIQFKLKVTEPLTEVLFENKVVPTENFYITNKGIGFSYSPYEIAAYAVGEINLFINYSDLAPYLQPAFKKILE